jgi:hypothetical protein
VVGGTKEVDVAGSEATRSGWIVVNRRDVEVA